jgi:hypothetical protein
MKQPGRVAGAPVARLPLAAHGRPGHTRAVTSENDLAPRDRPAIPLLPVLLAVVGAVVLVAVFPLTESGYAAPDDYAYAVWARADGRWAEVWRNAVASGRLTMLVHVPLNFVPYLVEHPAYLKFVQIGSIVATLALFAWAVARFTGERSHGLLAALLFAGVLPNMWEHHLYAAYPFVFQLGAALVVLALLAFRRQMEGAPPSRGALAGALFFLALLTYELFLTYAVVFAALAWSARRRLGARAAWRALVPVLVAAAVFLASYGAWRATFPSDYAGARVELDRFDAAAALRVVRQFSLSALPGFAYARFDEVHARFAATPAGFSRDVTGLAAAIQVEWLLKALLVGVGVWLAPRLREQRPEAARLAAPLALGTLLVVLPTLPVALTVKYQEWVAAGTQAYVVTYLSYFGVIVAAAALTARIWSLGAGPAARSRRIAVAACATFWAALSLVTDAGNQAMHRSQALQRGRWELFRTLVTSTDFAAVPAGSCMLLDGLTPALAFGGFKPFLWQVEALERTGKALSFTDDRAAFARCAGTGQPAFLVRFRQEENTANQLIALAPVARADTSPLAGDRAVVYYSGVARRFSLLLRTAVNERPAVATVNGRATAATADAITVPIALAPADRMPLRLEVELPAMALDAISATAFAE